MLKDTLKLARQGRVIGVAVVELHADGLNHDYYAFDEEHLLGVNAAHRFVAGVTILQRRVVEAVRRESDD